MRTRAVLRLNVLLIILLSMAALPPAPSVRAQDAPASDGGPLTRPAPLQAVVRDDMRTRSLFWPRRCTSGANVGTFEPDGLRLRVTGRCGALSTAASLEANPFDLTMGDGEARVEFRVDSGWQRTGIGLLILDTAEGGVSLSARLLPSVGSAALIAEPGGESKVLARRDGIEAGLREGEWASLAIQRQGSRAWLVLNDEPILAANDVPMGRGIVLPYVNRFGRPEEEAEAVVTFANFSGSIVEGTAPEAGVQRDPRPVVDPRYERILAFIRAELVEDAGTDAQAEERRAVGRAILDMIEQTKVNLEVAPLTEANAARFVPFRRTVTVDERLMTFTPHVATTLLLHEIAHAQQEMTGEPHGCIDREYDAVMWQVRLWKAWFGPEGKQPPGDRIEADFTARVQLERAGRLRAVLTEAYKEQCARN